MGDSQPLRYAQPILDDQDPARLGPRGEDNDVSSHSNAGPAYPTHRGGNAITANPRATVSAERVPLETASAEIDDFFTDDDGRSLLEGADNHHPLQRATTFVSQLYSNRPFSTVSVNTVIPCGVLNISVSQLCDVVKQHRSLRQAEILSTECYTESSSRVLHRFLILELHREGRKDIWLRLDRRSGRSMLQLFRTAGTAPAKDTAQLATEKQDLAGSARLENRQVFETLPTLGELQYFLGVVCEELLIYKAWPENCYFYCSLIQEHLGAEGEGVFCKGELPYPDLAQKIRSRVKERVRLFYHTPAPLTLTSLLASLLELPCELHDAMNLARQWESLKNTGSAKGHKLADKLGHALHPIGETLNSNKWLPESVAFFRLEINVLRYVDQKDGRLATALRRYSKCLRASRRFDDACNAGVEAVALSRHLYKHNPKKYHDILSHSLHEQGCALRKIKQYDDACKAAAEDVTLSRHLYERDQEQHRKRLSDTLWIYAVSLREVKRFDDACDAGAEAVALSRHLYERDQEQYREHLSDSLRRYRASLREAKRFDDVCNASAESVALSRRLYERDQEQHREHLSDSLLRYGASLQKANRFDDACNVGAEAVALSRHLYECDAEQYWEALSNSLCYYGLALQRLKRFDDACEVAAEYLNLCRRFCKLDQEQHRRYLSAILREYGVSLREARQLEDACNAGAESAALSHDLYERDAERYRELFSLCLHHYSISLQRAERFHDACKSGKEATAFFCILYDGDPDRYRSQLANAVCNYDVSLRGAERSEDARMVAEQHLALFHQLWDTEPELDPEVLEYIRDHYGNPPQWREHKN